MYLERILISDFKNIESAELYFSDKLNCIWGNNGEGKTNLLDAIYYLSMTKSYFSSSDAYTFRHGTTFSAVNGIYNVDGVNENYSIGIKGNIAEDKSVKVEDKQVKVDGKSYSRISEHIGKIPVVIVSPTDTELIHLGGEERRRFLNIILSQLDKEYLRHIQSYNQLLLQRNKLLKMSDFEGGCNDFIETIDEKMNINAKYIFEKRGEISKMLNDAVSKYYAILSGAKEEVSLTYQSQLESRDLISIFKDNAERDRGLRYTSAGIHRDDLLFFVEKMPIKNCGSQGQQKTFLIALKLAQYELMYRIHRKHPILLLDDVFDKLDINRVKKLIELVSQSDFGQIFITDSSKVRMESVLEPVLAISRNFTVENGVFSQL